MSDPVRLTIGLIAVSVSALGYGMIAARFTKSKHNLAGDRLIGIAILTFVLMTGHFFVPLQSTENLAALLPGVLCFVVLLRPRLFIELLVLALAIWWAVQLSRTSYESFDHGSYHLPSVVWNIVAPVIPGLANLNTRFGFNSSIFILAAGLNIPALGGWSLAFLTTALIEGMIAADLLLSIAQAKETVTKLYCVLSVVILLFEPRWLLQPSYLSPDPVIAMGVLYAVLLFLEKRTPALLILIPFLITIKLSAAPLLLLLDWTGKTTSATPSQFLRTLWNRAVKQYKVAAIVGMAFICIWLVRNVVLSGYLVYPVALTKLPVTWAVGKARTEDAATWITDFARMPDEAWKKNLGLRWVRPWLSRMYLDERARSAAEMFCAGLLLLCWKRALRTVDWQLIGALAAALLYWFIIAPDVRFGAGFIFAAGFAMLAYSIDAIGVVRLDANNAWIVVALLALGLGRTAAGQHSSGWPKMVDPAVRIAVTPTGNRIWVPVVYDQCWTKLPCSPEANQITYYPKAALEAAPFR